ncbi:hypothetical protein SOPP22_00295 [Shewanella sp. OPT22]|nr:hypothetical protein SOPP22_00295 [Shewanella sp. OPT22]
MKYMFSLSTCALALGLTACGSDNKSTTPETPIEQPQTVTVQGKVLAHDHIKNALVYMDSNKDGSYNNGEPSTMSGEQGNYVLQNVSQADADSKPIRALITPESSDMSDNAMLGNVQLSSTASMKMISPCTDLVYNMMDNGFTQDSAQAAVSENIETCEPTVDYVAQAKSTDTDKLQADLAKQMQYMANTVMALKHEYHTQFFENLTTSIREKEPDVTDKELNDLIDKIHRTHTMRFNKKLAKEAYHARTGRMDRPFSFENFSPTTKRALKLTGTNLELMKQAAELDQKASAYDLRSEITTDGLFELTGRNSHDKQYIRYSQRRISPETGIASFKSYQFNGTTFELLLNSGFRETRVLHENQWTLLPNKNSHQITNGKLQILNSDVPTFSQTVEATEHHLDNLLLSTALQSNPALINSWKQVLPDTKFPENSKLFKYRTVANADIYAIHDELTCDNKAELNDICNQVNLYSTDETSEIATTLEQLKSSSPSNGSLTQFNGALIAQKGQMKLYVEIRPELNEVVFYKLYWKHSTEDDSGRLVLEKVGYSSWSQKQVNDKTVMIIALPESIRSFNFTSLSHKNLLFTVHEGFVRSGFFKAKGISEHDGLIALNKIALDTLLANVITEKWQKLTPPHFLENDFTCRQGNTISIGRFVPEQATLKTNTEVDTMMNNCVESSSIPDITEIFVPGTTLTSFSFDDKKLTEIYLDDQGEYCQTFYGFGQPRTNCQSATISESKISGVITDTNNEITQRWSMRAYKFENCKLYVKTVTEDDNWSLLLDGTKNFVGDNIFKLTGTEACPAEVSE